MGEHFPSHSLQNTFSVFSRVGKSFLAFCRHHTFVFVLQTSKMHQVTLTEQNITDAWLHLESNRLFWCFEVIFPVQWEKSSLCWPLTRASKSGGMSEAELQSAADHQWERILDAYGFWGYYKAGHVACVLGFVTFCISSRYADLNWSAPCKVNTRLYLRLQ